MDLFVFDMNGVLTEERLAYVLSEKYRRQGLDYWNRYRNGELTTEDTVIKVGATHKGLSLRTIEAQAGIIPPAEHSQELIKELRGGFGILIATADYENLARRIAGELQVENFFGNRAIYKDKIHTGTIYSPIVDGPEKARRALEFKGRNKFGRMFAIGDDVTCHELFESSDFSIAYNSRDEKLMKTATYCIDGGNLLDVVDILRKI